jgi:alpha-beta hydrolase superfamily lysophospholipase
MKEVIATLISSNRNLGTAGAYYTYMVIMTISFTHVAEKFNENNFDFYALDLRKYGRSLLKISTNYCKDIEEYFEEISIAISKINTISKTLFTCLGILLED